MRNHGRRSLAIILTSISSLVAALPSLPGQATFPVTVSGGYGSGSYPAGALVRIWSGTYPPSSGFDRWTGQSNLLENSTGNSTSFTMPPKPVLLNAVYRAAAQPWNYLTATVSVPQFSYQATFSYYFPRNPIGLIVLFHGTGGSGVGWFQNVEYVRFVNDAVARGFAVASTSSFDRVNKQWDVNDAVSTNPDLLAVQNAIAQFTQQGLMTSATPLFSIGMSQGGAMSSVASYRLGFQGACCTCSSGLGQIYQVSRVPMIWDLAQNDRNGFTPSATQFQQTLAQNGVRTQLNVHAPSPCFPQRFARIPGLSAADSQAIYNAFKAAAVLDANDFVTADPDTSGFENAIPVAYRASTGDISDQIYVCYTQHKFFSDFDNRVLEFFANVIGPPSSTLTNVSTRLPVQTGDKVGIGGFVVGGLSPKRVLIRVLGPSLSGPPSNVPGTLNDPSIQLYDSTGTVLAFNDNWQDSQASEIAATPFAPRHPKEAAIIATLAPGAYTGVASGTGGVTGNALIEVFDLDLGANGHAINVSTRGLTLSGDSVLIGGFVIGGTGLRQVVVRAIGPSLTSAGVTGALADPMVDVYDASGALIASNDSWQSSQGAAIIATGLAPGDAREAALLLSLPPGAYTAIVRGTAGNTGVALVEVYDVTSTP